MSIITFWNPEREQTGVTMSVVATATKIAIERNLKVLVVSTAYKDMTIKNCFWKDSSVRKKLMQGKNFAVENGVEGLARLISSNKIEPTIITDYTHVILKNTLEILDGYIGGNDNTKEENEKNYLLISKGYPTLLNVANQYYDMVFVDLSKELDESIRNEILEQANLNIYVSAQKLSSIDKYTQLRQENPLVQGPKNFLLIGKYNKNTKYNKSNIQKYLGEKNEISVIPFNTLLFEAAEETAVVDMFLKLSNIKDTTDTNYIFMSELSKLVEKIITKLKELQMRMR